MCCGGKFRLDRVYFILFYFICVALFRGETGTPMPSLRFLKNVLQLRSTAMRHDVKRYAQLQPNQTGSSARAAAENVYVQFNVRTTVSSNLAA